MTFVVWFFRALVILMVLRLVLRLFKQVRVGQPQARAKGRPQERLGGVLVRCATCGTHVPQDRALAGGGDVRYCSAECQEKAPAHQAPAHPRT